MQFEEKPTKKVLYYRKRSFGSTALQRTTARRLQKAAVDVWELLLYIAEDSGSDTEEIFEDLSAYYLEINQEIRNIMEVDPCIRNGLPGIDRRRRTIDSFDNHEIRLLFRFESKSQLKRLLVGLGFSLERKFSFAVFIASIQ